MALVRSSSLRNIVLASLVVPLVGLTVNVGRTEEPAVMIPPPALDATVPAGATSQTIVLAGGCFWGVQAVFSAHQRRDRGDVRLFRRRQKETAHYEMVGGGRTGHAESVAVTFDPQQISYGKILQIYFSVAHNPTELNYQGPDGGTSVSLGDLLCRR